MFHYGPSLVVLLLLCICCHCLPGRQSSWHGKLSSPSNASLTAACGESTTVRDNPWAAILWFDNYFVCGATLLNPDLAITAAHCVIGKRTDFFVLYYGRTFQPDTGIDDQGAFKFGGNTQLQAVRIHPNYDTFNKFEGFDIALLKLKTRIRFNELVKPISVVPTLQKYNQLWEDGARVQLAGLGQISGPLDSDDNRDYPEQMQLVEHRIVPQPQCNRGNDTLRFGPPRDVLCTRGRCRRNQGSSTKAKFKQICSGDSGSGIVGYFQEENQFYLLGVASYVIAPNAVDCGKSGKPAFSINARFHRQFIYEDFSWGDPADPVDCEWRRWTKWTECSKRCGGGSRSRKRIVSHESSNGGAQCEGNKSQQKDCNTEPCVSSTSFIEETEKTCPRDSRCEARDTCPYIASKYQEIKNLGKSKADKTKRKMIVKQLKSAICNRKQKAFCCPKSGLFIPDIFEPDVPVMTTKSPPIVSLWSDWQSWSSCSQSCGGGSRSKRRSCLSPPSGCISHDGQVFASQSQTQSCNNNNCPVITTTRQPIVLQWAEWQPWSFCSQSCGGGVQTRFRSNGKDQQNQRQSCNNNNCPVITTTRQPIVLHWSEWQAWSFCSQSCGGGSQTRIRSNTKNQQQSQRQSCSNNSCPKSPALPTRRPPQTPPRGRYVNTRRAGSRGNGRSTTKTRHVHTNQCLCKRIVNILG